MKRKQAGRLKWMRTRIMLMVFAGLYLAGIGTAADVKDVDDKDITNHIEIEMWTDQAVPSNAIDIKTQDGVVTLSGSVDNILAKERAEKIAEVTVGVIAVVNQIKVIPPVMRDDNDIKKAVKDALLQDPATESYEVNVKVDDGVVKLTGTVDSWQEKQLCATVTKAVKGVIDIDNKIDIDYKTERSDYEIEQEVKQRLANDIRVDDALIEVSVKDGRVMLDGTVGSLQEKNRASADAWVSGVRSVQTDDLQIKWWARDDMRRKDLYVSRSDKAIKEAVRNAFLYDPRVFSFNIGVYVNHGIVTLSGVVDNLEAKNAAEQDARNTMGVTQVTNHIKVRPVDIPSNDTLERKVSSTFLNDPYVERFELDISAYGGTVYLSGKVNTSWEKNRAENLAEGVKGVLLVVNNIESQYQWTWKPSWEIKEDVQNELFWSPFVDEDQVDIEVDNGIVTLTGNVDTYSERQSAEENAYEGGAKDVKNNLAVTYRYYGPRYYGPYSPYGYYYPIP